MPVELTIVESVTELETTVIEVVLESASAPGPAGPGVPVGGTDGQVLTKTSATDYATAWEDATGGGVTDADYLVGTAHAGLSAEIVVGTSPGGELGGTWASPTVDATHSGSSHASVQAAAEATAAAALLAHTTDSSDAHDASAISILDAANDFTATDVEGALAELQSDHETDAQSLADHIADATAAHAATAISFTPDGSISATTVQAAIVEVRDEAGGGGAPTDVDYLVGTASGGLSAEIVVGTSPGGELGGTWGSPTVDATHSGSSHASVQAAAEATAAAALSAHTGDTSDAHDASAISVDSTTLVGTGTDVQAVLEELDNGIADHLADATAAHAGSAISVSSATLSGTGTDVQAVFEEIDNLLDDHSSRHENGGADEISIAGLDGTPTELTNHLNDTTDAHDASAISLADAGGNTTHTDVEAAIGELYDLIQAASSPTWTSYTPTITAVGGGFNIGTGATQNGRYTTVGKMVIVQVFIKFGAGGGFAAGTGNYRLNLPVTCGANQIRQASGTFVMYDASANDHFAQLWDAVPSQSYAEGYQLTSTAVAQWSATVPAAPAANDEIKGTLILEID